ncbi:MAG: dynamin family protein [Porphyromonas sp.]|uniref:dynamin family protein n=1 Tax=Porphyromonas sp. TaxID=1924944 RepID=UPI001CB39767|nr:dynamin family protein [Porphyromonas sp.]MBF1405798.1 dynamin family protein [Porphyromonas sp.]
MDLLKEIWERKQRLLQLLQRAKEYGWIDDSTLKAEIKRAEEQKLTIGVIGQMKAGKSTFLNSFIFGDTILPAATSPMTASLSYITYGPEKKLVAEFYTPDEWAELRNTAQLPIEEGQESTAQGSKIKAAQELVAKAGKISQLDSLLGKTKEDSFSNLIDYVGADGKYIAITKAVTLYYPLEYLKGVEIVDTPGFNDPIVSREERTRQFLKQADVSLLLLYAGRAFDASDRDILFKDVRNCGIGKILVGINKYDTIVAQGETPAEITQNTEQALRQAAYEVQDEAIIELVQETHPIPFSAEMALLSKLPMSRISKDENLMFHYKRYCETFEISSQSELYERSLVESLNEAVRDVIERDKVEILLRKPVNMIQAAGNKHLSDIQNALTLAESQVKVLEMPDDELEDREDQLAKAERKLNRKIDSLHLSLEEVIVEVTSRFRNKAEDALDKMIDGSRDRAEKKIGFFGGGRKDVYSYIQDQFAQLETRKLPRLQDDALNRLKIEGNRVLQDFKVDVEDVLERYLPDDVDAKGLIKSLSRLLGTEDGDNHFSIDQGGSSADSSIGFFEGVAIAFALPFIGVIEGVNALFGGRGREARRELIDQLYAIRRTVDFAPMQQQLKDLLQERMESIRTHLIGELIVPLQSQIEEVRKDKSNKSKKLEEARAEIKLQSEKKAALLEQQRSISELATSVLKSAASGD